MALIVIAADKGAPGVTTTSVALGAVWPRPVLLAECDPSGGDLLYRLPGAGGERLDPRRGLLSLAVAARRGLQPVQVWEHVQKLRGGLDVLVGVAGPEQGAGLDLLWGQVGRLLAAVPQADVIADCGRLGVDGPVYDLLAHASAIVLLTRANLAEVVRLRERVRAVASAVRKRGNGGRRVDVVVVTGYKEFKSAVGEVGQAMRQSGVPAHLLGGIAYEPKSADQLRGEWGGRLDKSMLIRSARAIAADLAAGLPALAGQGRQVPGPPAPARPGAGQPASAPGAHPVPPPPAQSPAGAGLRFSPDPRPSPDPKPAPGSPPSPDPQRAPGLWPSPDPQSAPGSRPSPDPQRAPGLWPSPDPQSAPGSRPSPGGPHTGPSVAPRARPDQPPETGSQPPSAQPPSAQRPSAQPPWAQPAREEPDAPSGSGLAPGTASDRAGGR